MADTLEAGDQVKTPALPGPAELPGNPGYSWQIAAKKVAWALSKAIVSFLSSAKISLLLQKYGIHIDPQTMTATLAPLVFGGLVALHDYLKVHHQNWKWL